MTAPLPDRALALGDCVLRADRHELRAADGRVHRLPRRQVELLLTLASAPDQVWTRTDLLDQVWSRRMVADEVLSRAIADLRVVLGDDARAPRYVETLPKTGYRWIAPTRWLEEETADPPMAAAAAEPVPAAPADPQQPVADPLPAPMAAAPARPVAPLRPSRRWHRGMFGVFGGLLGVWLLVVWAPWAGQQEGAADPGVRAPPREPAAGSASADAVAAAADRALTARVAAAKPLTSDTEWETHVATSADGQWLAFARSAPFASETGLRMRHLASGQERQVPTAPGSADSPAFSVDGRSLVYRHCERDEACLWRRIEVRIDPATPLGDVIDASSEGPAAADRAGLDIGPAGWVAPSVSDPHGLDWRPMNAAGQPQAWRALTRPTPAEGTDRAPRWIPGTRRVAFTRGMPGLQTLHWLAVDQPSRIHRVEVPPSRIQDHRWWGPDEAWLASDLPGFRALVQWRTASGWGLLGQRGTRGLALLPHRAAVLEVAHYDADLYTQTLGAEVATAVRLPGSRRTESHPALSPDGTHVAFVSLREGQDQVWLQDLRGGEARRISPMDPVAQAVRPVFDSAGTALYFSRYEAAGVIRGWRYDLRTQVARALPELGTDVFAVMPLPHPDAYVFATHRADSSLQLWWQRGAGQVREPLDGAQQVAGFQVDGDRVWWHVQGERGWHWLQPYAGARGTVTPPADPALPVTEVQAQVRVRSWTVDQGQLWVVTGEQQLWAWDGQRWQASGTVQADPGPVTLAVNVRHRRVVSSRTQSIEVDLLQVAPAD